MSTSPRCRTSWRNSDAARIGIEEMNELEDAASADILTEICRGVDKWLWFVEAHAQDGREEAVD
jgi:hypothetical protein